MEIFERKQKTAFVVVGIPGSGKSTWIRENMNPEIDTHISRDEIRFALLNDTDEYFKQEDKVRKFYFQEIERTTNDKYTDDCVFIDATHLTPKARAATMQHIAPDTRIIALYFDVPIGVALERNKQRKGRALVPESAIYRMNEQLIKPTRKEGFYEVWYINEDGQVYGKEF